MTTQPDPRAAVLRAAGHTDAATLLESLNTLEQPAAQTTAEAPTQTTPAMNPTDTQREAEGRSLLEALYRDCPGFKPDTEPAT
jgi:hypothetical protein